MIELKPKYEYQTLKLSEQPEVLITGHSPELDHYRKATVKDVANQWGQMGWRVVSAMVVPQPGRWDLVEIEILVERPLNPYNENGSSEEWRAWRDWNDEHQRDD